MKFFLSAEAQAGGASMLMKFHRITQSYLNTLEPMDYGPELTDIAIITILVRREQFENGGYPERHLFQRKTRSADIRLRMDFLEFLSSPPDRRYALYCTHILDSIETLRKKVSPHFRFDDLILDVQTILEGRDLRDALTEIRRF